MVAENDQKSTGDCSDATAWRRYWDRTAERPPRPTLLRALDAFEGEGTPPGHAVDLGCGIGRDTGELLRRGWRVTAIDGAPEAVARLRGRLGSPALTTAAARLEDYAPPPCDLVNASFALFFLDGDALRPAWARLTGSLRPGGRFAGQLLGPEDSWVRGGRCAGLPAGALRELLAPWAVELAEEERCDAVTPRGERKHWHLWHLVLRRPC